MLGLEMAFETGQKTVKDEKMQYAGFYYEEAVRLFADDITRLCRVWTQDEEAAKDCFQNTFLKLYQTKKIFYEAEHMKAWLIRVAKNECNDYHRNFWHRNVELGLPLETKEKFYMDGESSEEAERLVAAIRTLSVKYREVLVLYYYQEYDTKEISEILHISVNTVKSRLRRGRNKLGEILRFAGKQ